MTTIFQAHAVHCSRTDDLTVVGWADDRDPPGYLLLQRGNLVTAQDIALGLDGVHVELGDQSRSGYGGVVQVRVERPSVTLVFTPARAAALRTETELTLTCELDDDRWRELVDCLQDLWADQPEVVVVRPAAVPQRRGDT